MAEAAPLRPAYEWALLVRRSGAVLVGAVFLYAGLNKVTDPLRFANDIANYQMIPWTVGMRLAFYLPWLEIICGLALISNQLFGGAVAVATGLLLAFTGATIAARAKGIDISCGCFGTASSNLTLTWHLVINGCLLAILLSLWISRQKFRRRARV